MAASPTPPRPLPISEEITLSDLLGEGGVGRVHRATQASLRREVAVKGLRPDVRGPAARRLLLQEALVTGMLEHPNVVPVHALAHDPDGWPLLIMKRVEGRPWSALLLAEPSLDRDLGILVQVCNAVHFAHSRGILHRDLKPDNVMIGAFGEVVVVDWGLAASLREEHRGHIPLAREERRLVGTPHYLAPEMLRADGPALSARTDVYLLGAILYEILAGEPPHARPDATTDEILAAIPDFLPLFPEDAPGELASLCSAALSADPAQRPESALAFQQGLQAFLDHRGAVALAAEGRRSIAALRAALALPADRALQVEHAEVYRLFGAARLALQQALRIWPGHPSAAADLRAATLAMIRYELAQQDPRAAEILLASLGAPPPPELRAALAALQAEAEARAAEARRLREDIDPRLGQRTRIFIGALTGSLWTLSPLVIHRLGIAITPEGLVAYSLGVLVLLLGLAVWARESMGRTAFNRRIMAGLLMVPLSQLAVGGWAMLAGQSGTTAMALCALPWTIIAAMLGITVDRRVLPIAGGYLLALFAATLAPERLHLVNAAANAWLVVCVLVGWGWPARRTLFRRDRPASSASER